MNRIILLLLIFVLGGIIANAQTCQEAHTLQKAHGEIIPPVNVTGGH